MATAAGEGTSLPKKLQPALKALEKDLLVRSREGGVEAGLRAAWTAETEAGQTGQGFEVWRRERITQVAVAWVLSLVFVRTLEDRGLIDARVAGSTAEALRAAEDREAAFTQIAPFLGPREYLLTVFRELARLPGARDVFDARHNPVWVLSPSAEGAKALLEFFRKMEDGKPVVSCSGTDTRFLGDLYQDLSADVRKRYALLQTPVFVEEFILEQTLDPAIAEFGLAEVRLIDPTCGSGHFLLGAFRRLLERWRAERPTEPVEDLARKALAQVYGVDINPYAVAIARFRLVLAVLDAIGVKRLDKVADVRPNVVVADSLLHKFEQMRLTAQLTLEEALTWGEGLFRLEDAVGVERVLTQRFHAVVGNPPFITEKDAAKREKYRELYESAAGKYALAAPFTERLFGLAGDGGYVGMINSNAWAKREYGDALVSKVLPRVDLNKIIDTSGCYLPGHGTPTLMLFGRNRPPVEPEVLAVLGKRGEREVPEEPSQAKVWSEIVVNHDHPGFDGQCISVEAIPRSELAVQPWILAGGGARVLYKLLAERAPGRLSSIATEIGFASFAGMNDAFYMPERAALAMGIPAALVRPLVVGENVRDWEIASEGDAIAAYGPDHELVPLVALQDGARHFWRLRATILATTDFGGEARGQAGDSYWDWYRWIPARYRALARIVFPYVATHNHFVIDRGGFVFNQHAPTILLSADHDAADHQALLGYLNSSTVGFWCRLVMFPKGGDQVGDGARLSATQWNRHLEYAGNLLQQLPVPSLDKLRGALLELVVAAERVVSQLSEISADKLLAGALASAPTVASLRAARDRMVSGRSRLRGILVSLQEEMDWRVYGLFGLPTVTAPTTNEVNVWVAPEHRCFELRLARELQTDISASEWFRLHQRTPPTDVAGPLAELYRQRLRLLDDPDRGKDLRLLETPETKRRWPPQDDAKAFTDASRDWLLDRVEEVFRSQAQPALLTARQLSHELSSDAKVQAVAELLAEGNGLDLQAQLNGLLDFEGVPFLSALRYTETGLEKRKAWEDAWELQRAEDQGRLDDALKERDLKAIPVPDKYATDDFLRHYWGHRGALDVPKERFTTVPVGSSDEDPTPLVGWAGWDHLQAVQALVGLYQRRKVEDGWSKDRLLPLLAGVEERLAWLLQWHNEPSQAFGGARLGDFFRDFLNGEAQQLGVSVAELRAWRPAAPAPRARPPRTAKPPPPTAEVVLTALVAWKGEADAGPDDLVKAVGSNKTAINKLLKTLVESGQAAKTSARPPRYRAVRS